MGFLDKAKEAANSAMAATQQAAQSGQAKIDTMQQGRTEGDLFKALGQAVYDEGRRGGDPSVTVAAWAALDTHFAGADAAPQPAAPSTPPGPAEAAGGTGAAPAAAPAQAAAAPAAGAVTGGNFTLDDL